MDKRYLVTGLLIVGLGVVALTLVAGIYIGRQQPGPASPAMAQAEGTAATPVLPAVTAPPVPTSDHTPSTERDTDTTRAVGAASEVQLTNRLADAASPYLRSAAGQAVAWQPFGEEAFRLAKELDRPILLDVGAVWCHWCHVMDEGTYADPEVATLINRFFVPVKIDMDERPDLNRRYQEAVQTLAGRGGWPLTVFMTPDGEVFFGGTYFPADDAFGRPGFKSVLRRVTEVYHDQREDITNVAGGLTLALSENRSIALQAGTLSEETYARIAQSLLDVFDAEYGGFGDNSKFPSGSSIELAISAYHRTQDIQYLTVVTKTLGAMASGGMRDQLGGGFHRYATDRQWHVPHFEIMNYGQSDALVNYLHAYQVTGNPLYRTVAEDVLHYVDTVLSNQAQGGFYASQDADMGFQDDGDYYTWTVEEVRRALPEDEAAVILRYFGIDDEGDMPSNPTRNVLYVAAAPEAIAEDLGLSSDQVAARIEQGKAHLLEARRQRQTPFVDKTILADRNGMMISAYLEAYKVLGHEEARDFALKTLDFLLTQLYQPGVGFQHAYSDGAARVVGLLGDQVEMATALLDAFEVTGEERYRDTAQAVMDDTLAAYWDPDNGAFFDLPKAVVQERLPGVASSSMKPFQDNPTAGPNAVATMVLDRLYYLTNNEIYHQKARETLEAFAASSQRYGRFAATYGLAVDYHINPPAHAVIVGDREDERTQALWHAALGAFRPGKIVAAYDPAWVKPEQLPPAVAAAMSASQFKGRPQAFVCVGTVCARPTDEPARVTELVETFGRED